MSNREWCPGCDSETSTLKTAFDNGEDCPYCGLGYDAWYEVKVIRLARDDDEMALKVSALRIENDRLERRLADTELKLNTIKAAMG